MLVAWKNFKDLNPLKIVAIIFTTCSNNTNTWNLFSFSGSHVNLRIKSDYFCKQFLIVGLYGWFSILSVRWELYFAVLSALE
jgi:hypothetical protein